MTGEVLLTSTKPKAISKIINHKSETIMAKKTETTTESATLAEQTPTETTAVVEVQKNELSSPSEALKFSAPDLEVPRINIIQKMSEIEGDLGSVVIDKEDQILGVGEKAKVVMLGATKMWKEDIPFNDEEVPKIVHTEIEAKELDDESSYDVIEFADLVMLIPQMGEDDTNYPYLIGDTNYQLGKITVQKDAYRFTYKRLFTYMAVNQDPTAVSKIYWNFSSESYSKGKYSWFVPMLSSTKELVPQEVLDFAKRLQG